MSRVNGYFLKLSAERYELFNDEYVDRFAEPVSIFKHPKNVPLICFIFKEDVITHIGFGKKDVRAGTNLRRLNILDIFRLNSPIIASSIIENVNSRSRKYLNNKINYGGILTPKSFSSFLDIFIKKAEETVPILNKY